MGLQILRLPVCGWRLAVSWNPSPSPEDKARRKWLLAEEDSWHETPRRFFARLHTCAHPHLRELPNPGIHLAAPIPQAPRKGVTTDPEHFQLHPHCGVGMELSVAPPCSPPLSPPPAKDGARKQNGFEGRGKGAGNTRFAPPTPGTSAGGDGKQKGPARGVIGERLCPGEAVMPELETVLGKRELLFVSRARSGERRFHGDPAKTRVVALWGLLSDRCDSDGVQSAFAWTPPWLTRTVPGMCGI